MESYKREFIQFLQNAGVLKFGDFTAKSGRKIPYFINAGEIKTGENIAKLGQFYARAYLEMGAAGDAGAYAKAAEYADQAITASGRTPLTQAQWEDPTTGFNSGAANNAWIWGLTVSSENISNLIANVAHRSAEALYGYGSICR